MQLRKKLLEKQPWLSLEGMDINTEEKRKYFGGFKYEVLTSNLKNKDLISQFISKKANNSLESYIRDDDKAWEEDFNGETRVYLIKDESENIALFFSIKCGLLVGENLDEKLSDDEEAFVDAVIEIKRQKEEEAIRKMYEAGTSVYGDDVDRLFEIADKRWDTKTEATEIGQSENTINVPNCISAIELRHLCKNENYKEPEDLGVPLGFGLFWEVIVPMIIQITNQVGCKYIYLFAADKTEEIEKTELKKLISYYKNVLKFSECGEGIKLVKPEYDNHCYGLIQEVKELEANREAVWHEFSDVL